MTDLSPVLLNRSFARSQVQPLVQLGTPLLSAVIDRGVEVFTAASAAAPDGDYNLGILFPFHHLLEMADGVEALLTESCVGASTPLLRSALEALIGIKYVLSDHTEVRAMSYVVADVKDRLTWYDRMDPSTDAGRAYHKEMSLSSKPDYPLPEPDALLKGRADLTRLLATDSYRPMSEEYERLRRERKRPPAWYALYGGPSHLRALAASVGDIESYLTLYGHWSKTTHAVGLARQLGYHDGATTIRVIRAPQGIEQHYVFAINFVLDATRRIINHYTPDRAASFAAWYIEEVDKPLEELGSIETE